MPYSVNGPVYPHPAHQRQKDAPALPQVLSMQYGLLTPGAILAPLLPPQGGSSVCAARTAREYSKPDSLQRSDALL